MYDSSLASVVYSDCLGFYGPLLPSTFLQVRCLLFLFLNYVFTLLRQVTGSQKKTLLVHSRQIPKMYEADYNWRLLKQTQLLSTPIS